MEKEEWNKYMREWNKNNKEKKRLNDKKWIERNPEKYKESNKRNAIIQNDKKRFNGMREIILERDNWSCVKCGMTQEQHIVLFSRSLTINHIDGKGRNDSNPNNSPENLESLCLRCHGKIDGKRTPHSKIRGKYKKKPNGELK